MSTSVELINLLDRVFAHPQVSTLASGSSKTTVFKQVNADDYAVNYDALAAFGVVVIEDGTPRTGSAVITTTATLTTEQSVVVDATAPFTITLADAATSGDGFRLNILVRSSAGLFAASVLTVSGTPDNLDQIEIGGVTYTWETVLTDTANFVLIGANAEEAIDNLVKAVTAGADVGVKYGTGTVANPLATAAKTTASTMTGTALLAGTAGNAITVTDPTDGSAQLSWSPAATMAGGDAAGDITVQRAGSDTVLGGTSTTLADVGDALRVVVSGTDWEAQ